MSNIIEKLEIKPILMYEGGGGYYVDGSQVRDLEQQRNELLEALIRNLELNQRGYFMKQKVLKDIIENADPQHRSWNEIKELL